VCFRTSPPKKSRNGRFQIHPRRPPDFPKSYGLKLPDLALDQPVAERAQALDVLGITDITGLYLEERLDNVEHLLERDRR